MIIPKTLLVFSHFDYEDLIDDYVVYYIEKLKEICTDIVFVSTSKLNETEKSKLSHMCTKVISRDNVGYDFMSYQIGLLSSGIDYKNYERVILCNDSVYAPLFSFQEMFIKMEKLEPDCWGVFENNEIKKHLQSFFLVFEKKIIVSSFLYDFFSKVAILKNKKDIINEYEVGLSQSLRSYGFNMLPYINYPSLRYRLEVYSNALNSLNYERNKNLRFINSYLKLYGRIVKNFFNYFFRIVLSRKNNSSLYFWKYSIIKNNPFMKIELFRRNPTGIYNNLELFDFISTKTNYPLSLIKNHIQRTKKYYER